MSSETAISVHELGKVFELGRSGRTRTMFKILEDRIRHPIKGGRVRREKFRALDGVTFDVAEGEVVGVIGKNGAGKSTLLKILSRITPPTEGYFETLGTVGSLLEVGTGMHPELTGLENVYLNGLILGMSKREIDRRLDAIVDFAEIDKFLDTPVKRYSSGMRVRLGFAVAAHLDPEILIVDEVLSVGDAMFQVKCLEKMRSVANDQGRTVLYVSHNLVTVENLCPRSILLVDGRVAHDGPTAETLAKYLNTFPHAERGSRPGDFDLGTADRSMQPGMRPVFQRLEIRPGGGDVSDAVRMGDRVQLEIGVAGLDEIPEPQVTIVVGSAGVERLFRITGRMLPLRASHDRCHDERIVVDIPTLPLIPGAYHLKVAVYDATSRQLLDEVHRAAEFTVLPADVLGTGYEFSGWDGEVFVPWDWEIRPGSSHDVASAATQAHA